VGAGSTTIFTTIDGIDGADDTRTITMMVAIISTICTIPITTNIFT